MYVRSWKHFDFALLGITLLLIGYGLAMIYSATYQTQGTGIDPLVYRQITYAAAGLGIFAALAILDYHVFANLAWLVYLVALGLLAVVLAIGQATHGAQRWIHLGPFDPQPSELAKLAVVLALAKYIGSREDEMQGFRTVLVSLAIAGAPAFLTFLQPDLGSSLVFVAIWLGMALVGRIRWRHLALIGLTAGAAMPFVWLMLHDYMRKRFETFMDPTKDPLGAGYNIIQAMIGVGSGGMWGRGFLSGTQSQLHFLRVQYADFVFSVLAEELGFIGGVALLVLFLGLAYRGIRVAASSPETFGRLFITGVTTMIVFQVFVNVGMNISLLPATGIPLPFISFGGSSIITILIGLGLVESIALHKRKFEPQ